MSYGWSRTIIILLMGLEKETPLNPPIIVNPKLLVQTVYKKCIKKYLGIIAFASSVIVHRKRLALLAFVLIQLVVFFCVAYSLTSKKCKFLHSNFLKFYITLIVCYK